MLNSQVEEIKSKIDIVDLVSEYIQVKQAGANWKALCPFHNEKTPSFMLSKEKQIWHCFGCGEGGDIFSFIQKIENVEFPEALKILATKAGVKLRKLNSDLINQKTKLIDICNLAAKFFNKALLDSKEGEIARAYLLKRKIQQKTIKEFNLGYAPNNWDILLKLLLKKGFKENDVFLSGLIVKNEKGRMYDRFRQRLMFPIQDHNSNVVGFTGRILDESLPNQGGKYVNTPQTLIYNKSLIIYGLDKAKNAIKAADLAVIVEGNMDVIASHQAGIKNVIASSGTALTLEQLKILQRYTNNLALAFDADLAGHVAAQRGIDNALSLGINVKIIQLPKEINSQKIKDPDDCIKQGPEYWQKAITQAVSIMDYYFSRAFSSLSIKTPQDKKEIAAKMLKQIAKLVNKVEQDHWLNQLAQKLDISENVLRETFSDYLNTKLTSNPEIKFINNNFKDREQLLAEQALAIVLKYPTNVNYLIEHLELEILQESTLRKIYKQLILYYNKAKHFDYSEFEKILSFLEPNLATKISTLMLLADKDFFDYTPEKISQELIEIVKSLKKHYISQKLKQIQQLLNQAEKDKNAKQIEELSHDFSSLTQQINNL
jgi:DNA primase